MKKFSALTIMALCSSCGKDVFDLPKYDPNQFLEDESVSVTQEKPSTRIDSSSKGSPSVENVVLEDSCFILADYYPGRANLIAEFGREQLVPQEVTEIGGVFYFEESLEFHKNGLVASGKLFFGVRPAGKGIPKFRIKEGTSVSYYGNGMLKEAIFAEEFADPSRCDIIPANANVVFSKHGMTALVNGIPPSPS